MLTWKQYAANWSEMAAQDFRDAKTFAVAFFYISIVISLMAIHANDWLFSAVVAPFQAIATYGIVRANRAFVKLAQECLKERERCLDLAKEYEY